MYVEATVIGDNIDPVLEELQECTVLCFALSQLLSTAGGEFLQGEPNKLSP